MCHATHGTAAASCTPRRRSRAIRGGEARRAAEICGAEYATLGFTDGEINAADPEQQPRASSTSSATRGPT